MIKPTIDMTGRIAIYARVSTEEQAKKDEGSLDNQIHRCRQYLTSLNKYDASAIDTLRVYREEGFSGKDTNRPEFQRLMRDIRSNKVGILVFTELSRVSRSVSVNAHPKPLIFARPPVRAHRGPFVGTRIALIA